MKKKQYKTLLFDWDGCLAQTLPIWLVTYRELFKKYNKPLTDQQITNLVFGGWGEAERMGIEDAQGFYKDLESIYQSRIVDLTLYDGVSDLIKLLKANNKEIVIISSSFKQYMKPVLQQYKIYKLINFIFDGNDVIKHKPDPEIVNKALKKLKGDKKQSIVIGDSKSDLGAAQAAEVDSVLFYPKSHELIYDKQELMKYNPTYVVESFKQMEKILL